MENEEYIDIADGLSVGTMKIANKYEIFTEEEVDIINNKIPELDKRVDVIEDEIVEINSSLDSKANNNEVRKKEVKLELEDMSEKTLQAIQGGEGTTFELLSIPQDYSITDEKISSKSSIYLKERMSLNMFDKSRITDNCYIIYTSGELSGRREDLCVTDFIPIESGKKYRWSPSNQQWCYFDENRKYVSGKASVYLELNDVPTPEGVSFIRLTLEKSNLHKALFYSVDEYEKEIWNNRDYNFKAGVLADGLSSELANEIMTTGKIYTVKKDGSGDFTTLEQANAKCLNGKENARYKILVYEGTYTPPKDFCLNDYVDLIGVNREKCIVTLQQSNTENKANIERYSTFNLVNNNEIKNLTITCKNARYPIHDDGGRKDITRVIENCHIEHLGNQDARNAQGDNTIWTSESAYGMGTRSGNKAYFKNCNFKANFLAWSTHNNINFETPCYIEHENCNFVLGENPVSQYKYSLRIQSDGSLVKDRIIFKGCKANYPLLLQDYWLGDSTITNRVEWIIEGYNNDMPFASEYTTGEMQVPEFSDEVRIAQATENIVKGNLCVYDNTLGKVRKMLPTDDISIFAGISIEDKNNGGLVKLKYKGYAYKKWITTLNTPFGTLFGCGADSKLAITTDKSKAILMGIGVETMCFKFL